MAERRVRNAEVRGSTPLCSTNRINDLGQGSDPAFFICHQFVTWSNWFDEIFDLTYFSETVRLHLRPATVSLHNLIQVMRRDIFQAIADPTRRAIIALIALQAMTPNAIAEHFDTTRQAVSKHLRVLTECELVTQEQKGREIYYSLEVEKMKEIDKWLEQYRKIWEARMNQLDELLAAIKQEKEK